LTVIGQFLTLTVSSIAATAIVDDALQIIQIVIAPIAKCESERLFSILKKKKYV